MMYIQELVLAAAHPSALQTFYGQQLELPVTTSPTAELVVQVGTTRLVFRPAQEGEDGRYHFAFNIPHNLFASAKEWLAARVPLIADENGRDEFYSAGWQADMCYFYDPAGNVLELIARHTLDNAAEEPFGSHHLLNVSEIGVSADDVPAFVRQLQATTGLPAYGTPSPTFAPLGDEQGLLIVVQTGREWFPQTGIAAGAGRVTAVFAYDGAVFSLSF